MQLYSNFSVIILQFPFKYLIKLLLVKVLVLLKSAFKDIVEHETIKPYKKWTDDIILHSCND